MFFKKNAKPQKPIPEAVQRVSQQNVVEHKRTASSKFYEHLAKGNALAEAEDNARRKWQGR